MKTLATLKFRSHHAYVSQDLDSGRILVFKYTANRCDLEVFDTGESAGEYLLEPFPEYRYVIDFSQDSDCE